MTYKTLVNLPGGYSAHANDLESAGFTARYGNGGTRNLEKICKEFDDRLVGPALHRGRGQGQLQRVTHCAGNAILAGTWLHLHAETHTRRSFTDRNHFEG